VVAPGQQQKSIVTEAQVSSALDAVIDPHMKVGMNDMGMITDIEIDDQSNIAIGMVFPCIGCPAWTLIQDNIKAEVGAISGAKSVSVSVDWSHTWEREDMSEKAKQHAQTHGYRI